MPGRCKGFSATLVVLALGLPVHALAGPYEDGESAYHRKDYAAAMQHWRPVAETDARAQAGIAAMYLGGLGVAQDYQMALAWCERAVNQGEAKAQYLLGSMYRDGKGVPKDPVRAMELFRKAADQDLHWAQYNLGLMYFLGEGIPADLVEAYHWLALATAVRDDNDAQVQKTASFMLEQVSTKLTGDQITQVKQRVSDWKPSSSVRNK